MDANLVYAVLTKDRFPPGEFNKLAARKIGPVEVLEKINPNVYRLNLPSTVRTTDVFNVKHLVPYFGDNSEDAAALNSGTNSFKTGGADVNTDARVAALTEAFWNKEERRKSKSKVHK